MSITSQLSHELPFMQDRIGGRIHTFRSGPYVADLGAMVVTGLGEGRLQYWISFQSSNLIGRAVTHSQT